MAVLLVLLVVLVLAGSWAGSRRALTARRERALGSATNFRLCRRVADEDVTTFGEELTALHVETLADDLDDEARRDYQRALDAYEDAKQRLRESERERDVTGVTRALEDGRFAMACVLARRDHADPPARRPPCFFNPAHGPAESDVSWAPTGGVEREIPVCFRCRERLGEGSTPDVRTVRWGNRRLPWFQAGPSYGAYVDGYYGAYARDGLFPAFILSSLLLDPTVPGRSSGDWSGWSGGTWVDDGPGAYDWGGWHGTGSGAGDGFQMDGWDSGGGDGGGGGDSG